MDKLNCEIVKDLLPLYIDNVCSEESTNAVEEHIKNCPICEAELVKLQNSPEIKPDVDSDIDKAVKNAKKRIKKGKKKAVIKTISFTIIIATILGIIGFFQIPLALAYIQCSEAHTGQYEKWDTETGKNFNYENKFAKCFIDQSYGKYDIIETDYNVKLEWNEDKYIVFQDSANNPESIETTFREYVKESNSGTTTSDFTFIPGFVLKKGIENIGFQTEYAPGHDDKLMYEMIKMHFPYKAFFLNFNDYCTAYAYYHIYYCYLQNPSGYHILGNSKNNVCWGLSMIREDSNTYFMHYQPYNDIHQQKLVMIVGFTKEEAQKIFASIVIK